MGKRKLLLLSVLLTVICTGCYDEKPGCNNEEPGCYDEEPDCYKENPVITENEAIAQSIMEALGQYEQVYGTYPETLDELSPKFIDEIPLTVDGYEFSYRYYSEIGYEIGFSVRNIFGAVESGCGYMSRFDMWECSPGVPP